MKIKYLATLLIVVVLFELTVILFIIHSIRQKVLGVSSVAPIAKDSLIFSSDQGLQHFYEPKPNSLGNNSEPSWLTEKPIYTINSDSLNERFDYPIDKPNSTFRIVTLGDSFTYGLYVNTKENWPELLEDSLNNNCRAFDKYEVINLGVPGYDIRYEVERFKKRAQKYNPDLVLWFLKYDDFDLIEEYTSADFTTEVNQETKLRGTLIGNQLNEIQAGIQKSFLDKYGVEQVSNYQRQALNSINNYFRKDLVIFSQQSLLRSQQINDRKILDEFISSRLDSYLYLISPELNGGNGTIFPDGHPNQAGHKLIAQDLFRYLTNNKFIKCT